MNSLLVSFCKFVKYSILAVVCFQVVAFVGFFAFNVYWGMKYGVSYLDRNKSYYPSDIEVGWDYEKVKKALSNDVYSMYEEKLQNGNSRITIYGSHQQHEVMIHEGKVINVEWKMEEFFSSAAGMHVFSNDCADVDDSGERDVPLFRVKRLYSDRDFGYCGVVNNHIYLELDSNADLKRKYDFANVTCSWDEHITNGEKWEHEVDSDSVLQTGKTGVTRQIKLHPGKDFISYTFIVILPDDPEIAGPQSITIEVQGVKKEFEFELNYLGALGVDQGGWGITDPNRPYYYDVTE